MASYVIADIHGQYDMFLDILRKIGLRHSDTLYILGDILDRGPYPITTIKKIMQMPNVVCLAGNHELMAIECLEILMEEITEQSIRKFDEKAVSNLEQWSYHGNQTTLREFRRLSREEQQEVVDFIKDFLIYEELFVGGKEYLLVHAGLGNFRPDKDIEEYSLKELIWDRADYSLQYYEDIYVVTGHTPTQFIAENPYPGYIYRNKNHIAIDCGACYEGGRLSAFCLDTGEEFYSFSTKELRPI